MVFLLYISHMKNSIRICAILCMSAMLSTVASANPAQVPKTEQCTVGPDLHKGSVLFIADAYSFEAYDVIILNDHANFAEAGSLAASIVKAFKVSDAEVFTSISFEGKRSPGWIDPGSDYKSPDVDLSYIWKYQHFHNC